MIIKELVINNLYRYGMGVNCVFKKDKILISGINHDEPGCDSNGSGKSSIPNICAWAIFGNSFTEHFQKEGVKEIIRRGCEHGSAKLTMSDDRGNVLIIDRGTGAKKKHNYLKINYNSKEIEGTTVTKGQEELLNLLNISSASKPKEIITDFLNTTYFSTSTVKGFIAKETTSKERFEIIERFLGLKRYSKASEIAREKKKEILSKIESDLEEIRHKEDQLSQLNIDGYEMKIEDCQSDIEEKQQNIGQLKETLEGEFQRTNLISQIQGLENHINNKKESASTHYKTLKSNYDQNEITIKELNSQIQEWHQQSQDLQKLYEKTKEAQISVGYLTEKKEEIADKIKDVNIHISSANQEISGINNQIQNHLKCPDCGADVMYYNNSLHHIDIEKLREMICSKNKDIQENQNVLSILKRSESEIDDSLNENQKKAQEYQTKKAVLGSKPNPDQLQSQILDLQKKNEGIKSDSDSFIAEEKRGLKILDQQLSDTKKNLADLGESTVDSRDIQEQINGLERDVSQLHIQIGQYQQQIQSVKDIEKELKRLRQKTNSEKKRADEMAFWETGFKEIKVQIIDEFLPAFEDAVNKNLQILKVGMQVDFNTKKKKSSVSKKDIQNKNTTKEEFAVKILMGKDESPLNVMSQGERGRVGMCVGFGLRELTTEKGNNIFNFLFIDEIADSLDSTGLTELINLLDDIDGQKFVISHNDELKNYFDSTVTAVRRDGVSTIQ